MKTLICTVGGSHQPIIKAIADNQPDFTLFVCSEDDPDTGKPGSYEQISKRGVFLKKNFSDDKPTLPNIPTQLGLSEGSYAVLRVYADDLDHAYSGIAQHIHDYVQRGDTIVVDYTGGTKTMSAALCLAALDHDSISLQLVTGSRTDLHKVKDGTEQSQQAQIGRTRFQLKLRQALGSWELFAYDDTLLHLVGQKPLHRDDRGTLQAVRNLSSAFSAWDRFDHASALALLDNYMSKYGKFLAPYVTQLRLLCSESPKRTPARLLDLWLNAQRRATQQRFDDATSRAYRLLEWSAQWLLETHANIKTDNVPAAKIPDSLRLTADSQGIFKAALYDAWALAACHCDVDTRLFWDQNKERMKDLLSIRNHSILAHGFAPITAEEWQRVADFIEGALLPLLTTQSAKVGLRNPPPQLPQHLALQPIPTLHSSTPPPSSPHC